MRIIASAWRFEETNNVMLLPQLQGTISRTRYLVISLVPLLVQYLVHGSTHAAYGGKVWESDLHLVLPAPGTMLELLHGFAGARGIRMSVLVLVALLDFAVAGLLLVAAVRRARTTNRSSLVACLATVPLVQIPVIGWLGWSESIEATGKPIAGGRVPLETVATGLIAGLVIAVVLEIVSTLVFRTYGFVLFLGSPFIIGCVTGYIGNRRSDIGASATTRLVLGACFLGCVCLLAVALEGILCIVLAAPLIALTAWFGGLMGRTIALKGPGSAPGRMASSFVALPLLLAIDWVAPPDFTFESVESIRVTAPPRDVWDAIVHMGPIPDPPAVPFRWGLAYPTSGTIHGSGVGAIREGVFSTGVAYERVTAWHPNEELAFIVLSDPPTLHELSPYREVHAPHLNGYFRTSDARFTIMPLADGHTLLSLTTRHELLLGPSFYWAPIAKWAVYTNKRRVLAHFAKQAEATAAAESTP